MANVTSLDLDTLQPEGGEVKLGGRVYHVDPPKMNTIVKLARIAGSLEKPESEAAALQSLSDLNDLMQGLIPDLEPNTELNMAQAGALIKYVFELASPPELRVMRENGLEPVPEKKTTDSVS